VTPSGFLDDFKGDQTNHRAKDADGEQGEHDVSTAMGGCSLELIQLNFSRQQ
jgi:hypothetical protein